MKTQFVIYSNDVGDILISSKDKESKLRDYINKNYDSEETIEENFYIVDIEADFLDLSVSRPSIFIENEIVAHRNNI